MVRRQLGRASRAVSGSGLPSRRFGLGTVILVSAVLAVSAAFILDFDPLASLAVFTTLFAGESIITGVVMTAAGMAAVVSLVLSRVVGAGRKATAMLTAGGATAGGAAASSIVGAAGVFTGGGFLAIVGSLVIAIVVDFPFLTAIIGGSIVFFVTDPLGSRGGFLQSVSLVLKLAATALVAYLTVSIVGPDILTFISILPIVSTRGAVDG